MRKMVLMFDTNTIQVNCKWKWKYDTYADDDVVCHKYNSSRIQIQCKYHTNTEEEDDNVIWQNKMKPATQMTRH